MKRNTSIDNSEKKPKPTQFLSPLVTTRFITPDTTPLNSIKGNMREEGEGIPDAAVVHPPVLDYLEYTFPGRSPFIQAQSNLLKTYVEYPEIARIIVAVQINEIKYSLNEYVDQAEGVISDSSRNEKTCTITELNFPLHEFKVKNSSELKTALINQWKKSILDLCETGNLKTNVEKLLHYITTQHDDSLAMQSTYFSMGSMDLRESTLLKDGIERQECTFVVTHDNGVRIEDFSGFSICVNYPPNGTKEDNNANVLLQFPDTGKKPLVSVTTFSHYEKKASISDLRTLFFSAALEFDQQETVNINELKRFSTVDLFFALAKFGKHVVSALDADEMAQIFKSMSAWDDVVTSQYDVPASPGVQYDGMRVKLARQYAHQAVPTLKEIYFSVLCELALLNYVLPIFESTQDHPLKEGDYPKRLIKTLLIYLEYCLHSENQGEEEKRIALINHLKGQDAMGHILSAIEYSIASFNTKCQQIKNQISSFAISFPDDMWNNVKKLVRNTSLIAQLGYLAEQSKDQKLKKFFDFCEAHFSSSAQKADFDRFLGENEKENFPGIVKKIIKTLKKISQDCSTPYRDYSKTHIDPAPPNFLDFCLTKIVEPIADIESDTNQLDQLNSYYALLECCHQLSPRQVVIEQAIQDLIKELSGSANDIESMKERLKELLNLLTPRSKDKLCHDLSIVLRKLPLKTLNELYLIIYGSIKVVHLENPADTLKQIISLFDDAFYACCATEDPFDGFNKITQQYLEDVLQKEKSVTSDVYIYALILRHFYAGLFADQFYKKPHETCVSLDAKFREKEGWSKGFCDPNEAAEKINVLLKKISSISDNVAGDAKNAQSYINNIKTALISGDLNPLNPKGKAILSVCVWMAALTNRRFFSGNQVLDIYNTISGGLQTLEFNEVVLWWNNYKSLETLGRQAEDETRNRLQLSVEHEGYRSNIICTTDKYENPTAEFLRKGDEVIDSSSNRLQKTLWRHIAERFVFVTRNGISNNGGNRSTQHVSVELSAKDAVKQNAIKIHINLALLYFSEVGSNPIEGCCILNCSLKGISSERRQGLLKNIGARFDWRSNPEFKPILTKLFFSDVAATFENEVFGSDNFVQEIKNRFLLSPSDLDALTLGGFLEKVRKGLDFVSQQVKENAEYCPFLMAFMEPFFTSLIIIYEQLFKTDTIPNNVKALWDDCISKIEKSVDTKYSREFIRAWKAIIGSVFRSVSALHLSSATLPRELLYRKPYDLILAYDVSAQLGLSASQELCNRLWREIAMYHLDAKNVKTLRMLLGPVVDEYPSTEIDLYPLCGDFNDKTEELSQFLAGKEKSTLKSEYYPVVEVLFLENVLCIRVNDKYPTFPSKHLSSRTLDRIAYNVQRIYEVRLHTFKKALMFLSGLISTSNAEILGDLVLSTTLNHPVAFLYTRFGQHRCVQVYQQAGRIVKEDVAAKDAYLLRRAACVQTETSGVGLGKFIADSAADILTSIKLKIDLNFLNVLINLLHDAMALIYQSSAVKKPLTIALVPEAFYDDPVALSQCSVDELAGVFMLGVIYQALAAQENIQKNSAGMWLLNLISFFIERSNVIALGKVGIVKSGILNFGSLRVGDPVRQTLQELDQKLPLNTTQSQYYLWYQNYQVEQNNNARCSNFKR